MDSEDDNEEFDVSERFFERSEAEQKTFFARFLPEQTIRCMQYYLLRIPFLLIS